MLTPPFLLLDFTRADGTPQRLLFADPVDVVVVDQVEGVSDAIAAVERGVAAGLHAAGYIGYEAAPAFDQALAVRRGARMPLLWFGLFRAPVAEPGLGTRGAFRLSDWTPSVERAAYAAAIEAIRAAIERGDVYQVNYTLRLRAAFEGDDLALYERMRAAQRGGHGAYLHLGRHRVLSASPELFFRRTGDAIVTRPMKGTAPRGRWTAEDDALAAGLARSEKDRAENLMIVDLLRNDLGRVARVGSVHVPRLLQVERYPTVLQMTSTVAATLRAGTTLRELLEALFPCGSVTGAPKVSATHLISALEDAPREVYCGAIGHVSPGGDCSFSVAIRTLWIDAERGVAEYGVGGGVTWDSTPAGEYDEALAKAAVLTREQPRFELLETLRLEDGAAVRRERHLARLAGSARYFGFAVDPARAGAALDEHARTHRGRRRARLLAAEDGTVRVESTPLDATPSGAPLPVALADRPVSRRDPFLFHKTTHRAVYEARRDLRPDCFDVLLWNEEGELTEFTIGNVVVELDGARRTPPLSGGLLAGTFRAELLDRGEVHEGTIRVSDLARATGLWLVNSVREWVAVRLVD